MKRLNIYVSEEEKKAIVSMNEIDRHDAIIRLLERNKLANQAMAEEYLDKSGVTIWENAINLPGEKRQGSYINPMPHPKIAPEMIILGNNIHDTQR